MRIKDIIIKDIKVLLRDKKTIGIMFLMPIILTTILGFALGGTFESGEDNEKRQVAIVKEYDEKSDAELFIEELKTNSLLSYYKKEDIEEIQNEITENNIEKIFFDEVLDDMLKDLIDYRILNLEEAKKLLRNDEITAIIVLPEKFAFNIYTNFFTQYRNNINIEIIENPERYIDNQVVRGVFGGISDNLSAGMIGKSVFIETVLETGFDFDILSKAEKVLEDLREVQESTTIKLETKKVSKKDPITGFQYYTIAMAAMYILFAAGEGGKLLLEEKDNLTYQRMVVAGVPKVKIATGKFFTIFSFAIFQIGVMLLYSILALGVDWGDLVLVAAITLCAAFTIAGLGTMLASVSYSSGNYKMADVFQSIIVFVLSMLGGSFLPIEVLPKFIRTLSNFVPNGLVLKAYKEVMLGSGLNEIMNYLLSLLAMGVVFTAIAIYILNKEKGWKNVKYNSIKTSKIEG